MYGLTVEHSIQHIDSCSKNECSYCSLFRLKSLWILFKAAEIELEKVDPWIKKTRERICIYCGVSATTKDHIIPTALTGDLVRELVPTVPACKSCNSSLGNQVTPNLEQRALQIYMSLRRKNRYLLGRRDLIYSETLVMTARRLKTAKSRQNAKDEVLFRLAVLGQGGATHVDQDIFSKTFKEAIEELDLPFEVTELEEKINLPNGKTEIEQISVKRFYAPPIKIPELPWATEARKQKEKLEFLELKKKNERELAERVKILVERDAATSPLLRQALAYNSALRKLKENRYAVESESSEDEESEYESEESNLVEDS